MAALRKQPGGNKTIAAVIAGTGEHNHPPPGTLTRRHRLGDCLASVFHQCEAGYPASDGQAVGFRHLRIAKDLDH